eukprot:2072476-Rhodomonas_salina.3
MCAFVCVCAWLCVSLDVCLCACARAYVRVCVCGRVACVCRGSEQDVKLREQALKLCNCCLSYDFIGTSNDESTEDVGTVQVLSAPGL